MGAGGEQGPGDSCASPARVDWKPSTTRNRRALPLAQPRELHQTLSYPGRGPGSLLNQAGLQDKTDGPFLLDSAGGARGRAVLSAEYSCVLSP